MKHQRSAMARLIGIVSAAILVPLVLVFVVFLQIIPNRMEAQARSNAESAIARAEASVENSVELARDLAYSAIADLSLREIMRNPDTYLNSGGRAALERIIGGVVAYQSSWGKSALNSVYLFREDGQFTFYSPKGSYIQERRKMSLVYQIGRGLSSTRSFYRFEDVAEDKVYFLLDYKNIDNMTLVGKFVMELNAEEMIDAKGLIDLYPGTCVALTDAEGQILSLQGADDGMRESLVQLLQENEMQDFVQMGGSGQKNRYYHVGTRVGDNQLYLEFFIPFASIYGETREITGLFCIFVVLALLIGVSISVFGGKKLMQSVHSLENSLEKLSNSDYTARMPHSEYREMNMLATTFNTMADHLGAAFQDAYQKGIQLQESESRLLASQINPHFVFNVLETINMQCVDAGLKNISHMVTDLAQLLRGNIGIEGCSQKITFEQELRYVRYYIELQQYRFGDSLQCIVDYENEEILRYLVPRLTIQPLVENAVVHGLEPRRGLGSVSVQLWEEDSSICVRVKDNGVGFDAEKFRESDEENRHNHIALTNIQRRLRLLYGGDASLEIWSAVGKGTSVVLTIPIDTGGKES